MRLLIAALAVAVVAVVVVPVLFLTTIPDMNANQNARGATATSYADIKFTVTFEKSCTTLFPSGQLCVLTQGASAYSVHEVLAVSTSPATIFDFSLATIAAECHAKIDLFWATTDDSGTSPSKEKLFTPGSPVVFPMGHLNIFTPGTVQLSATIWAQGCGAYTDWTKIGQSVVSSFNFDGVDAT